MLRSAALGGKSLNELFNRFTVVLPWVEDRYLMKAHEATLKMIVEGYCYHERCLAGTRYSQWKSWANTQIEFQEPHRNPQTVRKIANAINDAVFVYENWDNIVRNLTDPRIDILDARRFSIQTFRKAARIEWCLSQNESDRPEAEAAAEERYDDDKYQTLLTYIKTSGILADFDHDPHVAAMLMKKLTRDVVKHCKDVQDN